MPTKNLGAKDCNAGVIVSCIQQGFKARGIWRTVIVQEPHPSNEIAYIIRCFNMHFAHMSKARCRGLAKTRTEVFNDDSV